MEKIATGVKLASTSARLTTLKTCCASTVEGPRCESPTKTSPRAYVEDPDNMDLFITCVFFVERTISDEELS